MRDWKLDQIEMSYTVYYHGSDDVHLPTAVLYDTYQDFLDDYARIYRVIQRTPVPSWRTCMVRIGTTVFDSNMIRGVYVWPLAKESAGSLYCEKVRCIEEDIDKIMADVAKGIIAEEERNLHILPSRKSINKYKTSDSLCIEDDDDE